MPRHYLIGERTEIPQLPAEKPISLSGLKFMKKGSRDTSSIRPPVAATSLQKKRAESQGLDAGTTETGQVTLARSDRRVGKPVIKTQNHAETLLQGLVDLFVKPGSRLTPRQFLAAVLSNPRMNKQRVRDEHRVLAGALIPFFPTAQEQIAEAKRTPKGTGKIRVVKVERSPHRPLAAVTLTSQSGIIHLKEDSRDTSSNRPTMAANLYKKSAKPQGLNTETKETRQNLSARSNHSIGPPEIKTQKHAENLLEELKRLFAKPGSRPTPRQFLSAVLSNPRMNKQRVTDKHRLLAGALIPFFPTAQEQIAKTRKTPKRAGQLRPEKADNHKVETMPPYPDDPLDRVALFWPKIKRSILSPEVADERIDDLARRWGGRC